MSAVSKYRISLGLFVFGLVVSGLTAFPLLAELSVLVRVLGIEDSARHDSYSGLDRWVAFVHHGLEVTYARFPFIGYGTDWLAFGHLVIALFFIGPAVDPVHNRWVLYCGVVACAAVLPLALVCGAIRGIPLYWRLIDCSFGLLGAVPLVYCIRLSRRIERERAAEAA
jgi:hypothetical protein